MLAWTGPRQILRVAIRARRFQNQSCSQSLSRRAETPWNEAGIREDAASLAFQSSAATARL
jgi:hypothetical protein